MTSVVCGFPALAADTAVVRGNGGGADVIVISGRLDYGDDYRFVRLALENPAVRIAVLSSPGGSLDAGLLMARAMRQMKYFTFVPPRTTCASACTLAWLGGVKRFLSDSGRIGFHAAHIDRGGVKTETGVGNALVGAFLNEIGLSRPAVVFITQAPPEGIQWLRKSDADALGIDMELLSSDNGTTSSPTAPATNRSPTERRGEERQVYWRARIQVSQGIQNVRQGPGSMHKLLFSIPAGNGGIRIRECWKPDEGGGTFDWCLITWNGQTGWTSSNGIEVDTAQQ
ncbi:MAG: hypothetical protein KGP27_01095 [Hyphomicrobiales bacterium]|nr:hypothetical protein [Hyphomicrobiales bacterium]